MPYAIGGVMLVFLIIFYAVGSRAIMAYLPSMLSDALKGSNINSIGDFLSQLGEYLMSSSI